MSSQFVADTEKIPKSLLQGFVKAVPIRQNAPMDFIEKIDRMLAARKISQDALEKNAALPHGRISKWRNDKTNGREPEPTVQHVLAIAQVLRVSPEYLMDEALDKPYRGGLNDDDAAVLHVVKALKIDADEAIRRLACATSENSRFAAHVVSGGTDSKAGEQSA
jgi:transcriptional regulator with XRE-family HTH domain